MNAEQVRQHASAIALDLIRDVDTDTVLRHLEESGADYDHTDVATIERLMETGDVTVEFRSTP